MYFARQKVFNYQVQDLQHHKPGSVQVILSVERVLGMGLPFWSTHQQYSPEGAHWTGLNSPSYVHWATNTPGAADPDQARAASLSF